MSRILDFSLTWEMLEADIQNALQTKSKLGPNHCAKIMDDGNGFISCVLEVKFDWTLKSEQLPEVAVLKITNTAKLIAWQKQNTYSKLSDPLITSSVVPLLEAKRRLQLADTELEFYESARNVFRLPEELKLVKFICGRKFETSDNFEGEHVDNARTLHLYDNLALSAALELCTQLAILSAHSLQHPEYFKEAKLNSYSKISDSFVHAGAKKPFIKKSLEELFPAIKYLESYASFKGILDELCPTSILCHGDVWQCNMLFRTRPDGTCELLSLIDWQLCNMGNPLEDIVKLIVCTLDPDQFAQNRDIVLEHYYDETRRRLNNAVSLPWESFDKFVECFEKNFVITAVWFGPTLINMETRAMSTCKGDKAAAEAVFDKKVALLMNEAAKYFIKWNM